MRFNKFVLYNNTMLCGCVENHCNLLPKSFDLKFDKLYGGGHIVIQELKTCPRRKRIIFHGASYDYGMFNIERLKSYILERKFYTNRELHKIVNGSARKNDFPLEECDVSIMLETHECIDLIVHQ